MKNTESQIPKKNFRASPIAIGTLYICTQAAI